MTTFTLVEPTPSVQELLAPSDLTVSACFRVVARRIGWPEGKLRKAIYEHELTYPMETFLQQLVTAGLLNKGVSLVAGLLRILNDVRLPDDFNVAWMDQAERDFEEELVETDFRRAYETYQTNPADETRRMLINATKKLIQSTDKEVASKLVFRGCLVRELERLSNEEPDPTT